MNAETKAHTIRVVGEGRSLPPNDMAGLALTSSFNCPGMCKGRGPLLPATLQRFPRPIDPNIETSEDDLTQYLCSVERELETIFGYEFTCWLFTLDDEMLNALITEDFIKTLDTKYRTIAEDGKVVCLMPDSLAEVKKVLLEFSDANTILEAIKIARDAHDKLITIYDNRANKARERSARPTIAL